VQLLVQLHCRARTGQQSLGPGPWWQQRTSNRPFHEPPARQPRARSPPHLRWRGSRRTRACCTACRAGHFP
jgi:hypothetical protein